LIPLLNRKAEHLHAEGVAQAVYALSQAGIYEEKTMAMLQDKIREKAFDYVVVKN
jgi:hypothetical protein